MNTWDKDYFEHHKKTYPYALNLDDEPEEPPEEEEEEEIVWQSIVWKDNLNLRLLLSPKDKPAMLIEALVLEVTENGQFVKLGSYFDGKTFWQRTKEYGTEDFNIVYVLGVPTTTFIQIGDKP